jgi:hypothetical protein
VLAEPKREPGNGIFQCEEPELSFDNYVDALNAAQRLNEQETREQFTSERSLEVCPLEPE